MTGETNSFMRGVIKKIYLYDPPECLAKLYTNVLKAEVAKNRPSYGDIVAALSFAFNYRSILAKIFNVITFKHGYGPFIIDPDQIPYEILSLLEILKEVKPRRILEIGTERGGTLFLFTYVAEKDAVIISIDLPPRQYRFGYSYPYWKEEVYKSFAFYSQKIHLIRGNSHDPLTLEKVKNLLGNKQLDFLFIDGDHTYEWCKEDFEMYAPLVRKGGIIAFHDIVEHPHESGCQVNRFWSEVKRFHTHVEMVENWNQRWAGIGVLFL